MSSSVFGGVEERVAGRESGWGSLQHVPGEPES